MKKPGFGGQWVEICRVGPAIDSKGTKVDLNADFLKAIVTNYNAGSHEAPIVIGHPESDSAPAYGWTEELRLNGDMLEARFKETNPDFEAAVANGSYKKKSASFYLEPPNLRHVGFLGAQPPAIKGLQDIKFADGDSVTVESINLQETKMKTEDLDQMPDGFWEKFKAKLGITDKASTSLSEGAGGGAPAAAPVSFTEETAKALIAEAVTAAKAEFKEQLDAKDKELTELKTKVDGQITGSRHSAAVAFAEAIPASKGKHYLKNAGVVEFVEALMNADAAAGDKKILSFSEGEGDDKTDVTLSLTEWFKTLVDELPQMIQFGEKFGSLTASKEADAMVDMSSVEAMRKEMGIKSEAAGGAN